MATSRNNRDVKLTLSVETLNEDSIDKLRQSVLQLAKEGGDAAPEFQQLADQIDRIGEQQKALATFRDLAEESERLAREQTAAKTAVEQLETALRAAQSIANETAAGQRGANQAYVEAQAAIKQYGADLRSLKANYDAGKVSEAEFRAEKVRLTDELGKQQVAQVGLRDALKQATVEQRAAAAEEVKLTRQYVESARALAALEGAQRQNASAVEEAASAARALSVATESVQGSSAELLNSLNQIGARAQESASSIREMADADRLLAIEQQALVELHQRGADVLQGEIEAQREAVRWSEQYAESIRQAAQAQREWQAEADALVEAAENTARLRREAEQLVETQRQLANQRAFEQTAADAAKLRQAAEYVRFWEQALDEADTQARQTAEAAETAAKRIANAFDTVGVRSVQDLQREIAEVRVAMATLASTAGVTGGQMAGAFAAGERKIRELQREIREVTGTLTTADKAAKLFANSMGQITAGNLIADGIGYLVEKVKEMGREFVASIVGLDQMRRGLNAIYKDSQITANQIDFLRRAAGDAGVSFGALSKEFVKFSASMTSAGVPIAQSNALFESLVASSAALGLGAEEVSGSLNALGQMASKGTVSMEELRQQLGDRLPGAFGLVAQGLGITQAELVKLVESGGLAATDLFPALTQALNTMRGETDGLVPAWERLKGALAETAQAAGDAGWATILITALKTLGVAFGAVLVPLQGFMEVVLGIVRSVATLVTSLLTLQNPLTALNNIWLEAGGRLGSLRDAFLRIIGVQGEFNAATATAAATAGEAARSYTSVKTEIEGMLARQKQLTIDTGKSADATKILGATLVELARVQGDQLPILQATTIAAQNNAKASAEQTQSYQKELDILAQSLAAFDASIKQRGGMTEALQKEREEIEKKIASSQAELDKSAATTEQLRQEAAQRRLAAELYADNSARVEHYARVMAQASDALNQLKVLQEAGLVTAQDMAKAQETLTFATARYNDAVSDRSKRQEMLNQTLASDNALTQAKLNLEMASLQAQERQARADGDTYKVRQSLIAQKELEIKMVELSVQAQIAEANAKAAKLRADQMELDMSDPVQAAKSHAIDLAIKATEVSILEAQARGQVVGSLKEELKALKESSIWRSENDAKVRAGIPGLNADTAARLKNVDAINKQNQALANRKTSDGFETNADGSAKGTFNNTLPVDQAYAIIEKMRRGQLTAGDLGAAQTAMTQARNAQQWLDATRANSAGSVSTQAVTSTQALFNGVRAALEKVQYLAEQDEKKSSGTSTGTSKTVNVNIGGRSTPINVASNADANSLVAIMRQLESASNTSY